VFAEILRFEVRYHLHTAIFWLSAALMFLLTFGAVTTDAVQIGGAIGNVNRNAPFVIMQILLIMGVIGSFVVIAFVAGAVLRDEEHGTAGLLFTTRVRKRDYVLGRFAGAFIVAALVMAAVTVAIMVGAAMPWLDPERVGPFMPAVYAYAFLVLVLPNLLLLSAFFFALATLTRSMMGSYVGLIALLVGWTLSLVLLSDIEHERIAVLIDPFGLAAFGVETKYWTTIERNTQVLPLDGPLLWNRLLWLGVALLLFAVTYARFSLTTGERPRGWLARRFGGRRRRREERREAEAVDDERASLRPAGISLSALPRPAFGGRAAWRQLARQTGFEVRGVVRGVPFLILLVLGILNVAGASVLAEQLAGTPVYLRTHLMITVIQQSFLLFLLIILTFYAGELVFRERQSKLDEIVDALPVPMWVLWGGKMLALTVIIAIGLAAGALTTIAVQLFHGFTDIQPGLYAFGLGFMVGVPFLYLAVLALAAQVATNQKYAGFLVLVLFLIAQPVLGALGYDHNLYIYAGSPPAPYSDMNGYGHFIEPTAWFYAYWGAAALVLLTVSHLLWVRGKDTAWSLRLRLARRRLGRGAGATLALAVVAFVLLGGWIFYNTNVLNEYVSRDMGRDRQAAYEREYRRYADVPQPRITTVYTEVDIRPEVREVDIRGIYGLQNRTSRPIDSLHLSVPTSLEVRSLNVPGATAAVLDTVLGYRIYALDAPLQPGATLQVSFDLAVRTPGFVNNRSNTNVVHNGTFLNSFEALPSIGYVAMTELQDPNERRKRDLPPVQRMPAIDDSLHLNRHYLTGGADWIEFSTVVSTSPDQIALAPGYLEREWEQGGRRYFHYVMDAPILPFWAYLSADWAVARDRWDGVEIAVYHHPDHPYNVERMIEATKRSLDYFTREFGPYQHRQVRIVEFPRYATFAQSFPNTIPFSESIGFIARLDDPDDVDYVFYVTAHEVAHQWWAHQVIGANVQGATVLSETLSQYSALMVMEEEYGPQMMRRFLKYELDSYLRGRGGERIGELPLVLVEDQPYIHYRKGSLAMYALRDYVGEDALNERIRSFLEEWKYQGPPYPTSLDLLAHLEGAVPAEHAGILDDLFRTITLWDLRATDAVAEPTGDGRWRVVLTVEGRKYQASAEGLEEEVPLDDHVDVGVFGARAAGDPPEGEVLLLEKRRVVTGTNRFEVVVDRRPVQAGIDPFNKLIDRNPEDNLTRVSETAGRSLGASGP
jgi:ABC-2 type transport system permease protein